MTNRNSIAPDEIRAVFFDAGDTLHRLTVSRLDIITTLLSEDGVDPSPAALAALRDREPRELDRIWDSCDLLYPDHETGQSYLCTQFRALLDRVGIDGGMERAAAIASGMTRGSWRSVFPEVRSTLISLRTRFKIGIISNAGSYMRGVYEELGMLELVDFLITSGEAGVQKPDPAIFTMALERAGVQPSQAIHVGDNPLTDVAGARASGIAPVLISRSMAAYSKDALVIASLADLLPILGLA